jgi:hypothetical protein
MHVDATMLSGALHWHDWCDAMCTTRLHLPDKQIHFNSIGELKMLSKNAKHTTWWPYLPPWMAQIDSGAHWPLLSEI